MMARGRSGPSSFEARGLRPLAPQDDGSRIADAADIFAIARYRTCARLVRAFGVRMSGSGATNQELDVRRKRLRFRAWHRGMREMDLVLGPFADAAVAGFSDSEIALFEALLEVPDPDLYSWITGAAAVPLSFDTALFKRLCAFHRAGQGR